MSFIFHNSLPQWSYITLCVRKSDVICLKCRELLQALNYRIVYPLKSAKAWCQKKHNRLFHGCVGIKVSWTLFGIERGARRDSLAYKDRLTHFEAVHGQRFVRKTDSSSNLFAVNCCALSATENRLMRFPGLPHQTSNAGKRQVTPQTCMSAKPARVLLSNHACKHLSTI